MLHQLHEDLSVSFDELMNIDNKFKRAEQCVKSQFIVHIFERGVMHGATLSPARDMKGVLTAKGVAPGSTFAVGARARSVELGVELAGVEAADFELQAGRELEMAVIEAPVGV